MRLSVMATVPYLVGSEFSRLESTAKLQRESEFSRLESAVNLQRESES